MNRNWLNYQQQIAMLLAAVPRTSSTWNDRQRIQLQPLPPLGYEPDDNRVVADRNTRRVTLPGIRRR
jgi:hypothetical protein